jgi:hypothetical protein
MKNNLRLEPLCKRIEGAPIELLDKLIGEFRCERDSDVERFLHNTAIGNERKGHSRTFLYLGEDSCETHIAAFFSIAIAVTDFHVVSKSRKKKILDYSTPGRDSHDYFGGLLVAQLARSDMYGHGDISGQELIWAAESIINSGREYVGGSIIYLDCKKPLIDFYMNNGYDLVHREPFSSGYFKMFKLLPEIF